MNRAPPTENLEEWVIFRHRIRPLRTRRWAKNRVLAGVLPGRIVGECVLIDVDAWENPGPPPPTDVQAAAAHLLGDEG